MGRSFVLKKRKTDYAKIFLKYNESTARFRGGKPWRLKQRLISKKNYLKQLIKCAEAWLQLTINIMYCRLFFLRYLSNKYEQSCNELEQIFAENEEMQQGFVSDSHQYRDKNVFVVPKEASWHYIMKNAKQPNIKEILDNAMKRIEEENPELTGVLPQIYQGLNLPVENVAGLIEIFSRDVFSGSSEDSIDILGRTYEYFISSFASSEGNRGGEFFTPSCIVELLVEMLEPKEVSCLIQRVEAVECLFKAGGMRRIKSLFYFTDRKMSSRQYVLEK